MSQVKWISEWYDTPEDVPKQQLSPDLAVVPVAVVPLSVLDEEEFFPSVHSGPCGGPDTYCDMDCMTNAGIAERNSARRTIKRLLSQLGE